MSQKSPGNVSGAEFFLPFRASVLLPALRPQYIYATVRRPSVTSDGSGAIEEHGSRFKDDDVQLVNRERQTVAGRTYAPANPAE